LAAKRIVTRAIERRIDPVAEELSPEVTNTPFAKQTRMLGIAEQTPRDHRIGDDPPDPWRLPHRTSDATECQEAKERWICGKNEPRLVSRLAWYEW
jgi:hypothetical protein